MLLFHLCESSLEDGLQRFGRPALSFFTELVDARFNHTGRHLRYSTLPYRERLVLCVIVTMHV